MANPWFRVWSDMVNDPKWRTIARVSKQEISRVIAVALHMMTCASNAANRGHTEGWNDEDVATALDIETGDVTVIREAMQGRVLDGDYLTGWEKRQPKREREDDNSTERSRNSRQRQKGQEEAMQRHATPCNANDNQETPREEESREDKEEKQKRSKAESATATRLLAHWGLPAEYVEFCQAERPDLDPIAVADRFRDYWVAKPGKDGRKADWFATWRNWVRNERPQPQARASPPRVPQDLDAARRAANEEAKRRLFGGDDGRTIDA